MAKSRSALEGVEEHDSADDDRGDQPQQRPHEVDRGDGVGQGAESVLGDSVGGANDRPGRGPLGRAVEEHAGDHVAALEREVLRGADLGEDQGEPGEHGRARRQPDDLDALRTELQLVADVEAGGLVEHDLFRSAHRTALDDGAGGHRRAEALRLAADDDHFDALLVGSDLGDRAP